MLPEKYHRIDDVFLVRAEDLHLPKEEVGQGHGWIVKLEPILEGITWLILSLSRKTSQCIPSEALSKISLPPRKAERVMSYSWPSPLIS